MAMYCRVSEPFPFLESPTAIVSMEAKPVLDQHSKGKSSDPCNRRFLMSSVCEILLDGFSASPDFPGPG